METTMLSIHLLAVSLFTLLIASKTFLLLRGKIVQLEKLKHATQVPEAMVVLWALGSGIYLAGHQSQSGYEWMWWTKLTLALVALPIGIRAFRYHKRMEGPITMIFLSIIIGLTYVYLL